MAIAILGWPIDKLSPEVANEVLQGARNICAQANIPLAGGHSIDSPEPIFGLAVTGRVLIKHLKQNNTAKEGDVLYLTKPLGVGILSTLEKRAALLDLHKGIAAASMKKLNSFGAVLGEQSYVNALTDVTGFGLLGHLIEMADGSGLTANINYSEVPKIPAVLDYLDAKNVPGGTNRNWASYGEKVQLDNEDWRYLLADPQTSGGLLVAVKKENCKEFEKLSSKNGMTLKSFGHFISKQQKSVYVHH
jgi:selenide,water dikinase